MILEIKDSEYSENDNNSHITQLESSRKTIPSFCEQTLLKLRDKSDIKMLADTLKYWKHIPEGELAKLLHFCLSINDDYFKNYYHSDIDETDLCPFSPEKASFLNKLLRLPFNDTFLQPYLLSIPFQDIMNLLQYLLYLLKLENLPEQPSFQEILSWLCIIIDTHFTNFILCKDSQIYQALSEIADLIKITVDDFKDMDNLELLLRIACSQDEEYNEDTNINCAYCIEFLYI